MKDYYAILGVPSSADEVELRQAYRQQALLHHPDKNPASSQEASEQFKLIGEAFEILRDERSRAAYDLSRDAGGGREEWVPCELNAEDLFREVVCDQFEANLTDLLKTCEAHVRAAGSFAKDVSKAAPPHVKAAADMTASAMNRAALVIGPHIQAVFSVTAIVVGEAIRQRSISRALKSGMSALFSDIEAAAENELLKWRGIESRRGCDLQSAQDKLRNHEEMCRANEENRRRHMQKLKKANEIAIVCAIVDAHALAIMCYMYQWFVQSLICFSVVGLLQFLLLYWVLSTSYMYFEAKKKHDECFGLESKKQTDMQFAVVFAQKSLDAAQHEVSKAFDHALKIRLDRKRFQKDGWSLCHLAAVSLHYAESYIEKLEADLTVSLLGLGHCGGPAQCHEVPCESQMGLSYNSSQR